MKDKHMLEERKNVLAAIIPSWMENILQTVFQTHKHLQTNAALTVMSILFCDIFSKLVLK